MKNKEILDTLNFDALSEIEKGANKHWSEFDQGESMATLGLQMMINEHKKTILKSAKDTYWGMDWNKYKNLLKENGFKEGYSEIYLYDNFGSPCEEEAILYFHPEHKLVIWSQSYSNMTSINSGKLYGYIQRKNGVEGYLFGGVSCSHGGSSSHEDIIDFDIDVREGLFTKLGTLSGRGTFVQGDYSNRFLWFLNLEDDSDKESYIKLTQQKIDKSTQECREILGR